MVVRLKLPCKVDRGRFCFLLLRFPWFFAVCFELIQEDWRSDMAFFLFIGYSSMVVAIDQLCGQMVWRSAIDKEIKK